MEDLNRRCFCGNLTKNECLKETCPYELLENFNSICHDLKNPLNIILSCIQILEIYESSGKIYHQKGLLKKYLNMLKQNSFRLIRLVNNILDVTKIESNLFSIKLTNQDMVRLLENITSSVSEYAISKGISVSFSSNVSEKILAVDPDKVERIMLNLISNAIKFTPVGGNIKISFEDLNDKVLILVQDNGIGMTKEEVKDVFNKYKQMKRNYKENEGTGLGLSLVKKLVELHHGKIWVESKKGKGTKFYLEFPVRLVKEEGIREQNINSLVEKINIEFSDVYQIF
ncbi:His Kinase A (phospho-acceptor) domain-containing protein [Caloramator fervidus]|uniref:histidine kinase n=1 Tax=Caloramator fervidus TaxID=29344 RepID=A0A1H5VCV7_9CLOT|nr:HAMP domain-containing sensor histidine kinase [Caloramator fervidus]SEF84926.1 His Kinase A (phospho-acceptor) domain-containing protein [Caloramator fervidus]